MAGENGYVELARDLLEEPERPISQTIISKGIKIFLSDITDQRLRTLAQRSPRDNARRDRPRRKWALQHSYRLSLPADLQEKIEMASMSRKSIKAQAKEALDELSQDAEFLKELRKFVIPTEGEIFEIRDRAEAFAASLREKQEEIVRLRQELQLARSQAVQKTEGLKGANERIERLREQNDELAARLQAAERRLCAMKFSWDKPWKLLRL